MIYLLHDDPAECAKMLDDKTLNKQIKTVAQVLCNVHHNKGATSDIPLSPTSKEYNLKEDYTAWASECRANYLKLLEMGCETLNEHVHRFTRDLWKPEKEHELHHVIEWCAKNIPELPNKPITYFPITIPAEYWVVEDPFPVCDLVESHRNYYRAKIIKKCNDCAGNECSDPDCCYQCDCEGGFRTSAKWTRRTLPFFIKTDDQ